MVGSASYKKRENQVFIHYNGWGNQWDEWIDINSPRIAVFRKYTLQYPSSRYCSPSPNLPADSDDNEIPHMSPSFNEMLEQTNTIITKLQGCIGQYLNIVANKGEETKDVNLMNEKKKQAAAKIAPFLDRASRLLCDFAPHFAHIADPEAFKDDCEQGPESNNEPLEESKQLAQVPLIANQGDVSTVSNLLDRILFGDVPSLEVHIHSYGNQYHVSSQAQTHPEEQIAPENIHPEPHSESGNLEAQTEARPEVGMQTDENPLSDAATSTENVCSASVGVQTTERMMEETKVCEKPLRDITQTPLKQKPHVGHIIIRESPKITKNKFTKGSKEFKITKTNLKLGVKTEQKGTETKSHTNN